MARDYPFISPERGFQHDDEPLPAKQLMRGHATAPGPRDAYVVRAGSPEFADGTPGVPRIQPTPMTHGPGVPGPFHGPLEVEIFYDGPTDIQNGAR